MTSEEREELKALIRTEPTLRATFASVDADFKKASTYVASLTKSRDEVLHQLELIEQARAALAEATGEPTLLETPAEETTSQKSRSVLQ